MLQAENSLLGLIFHAIRDWRKVRRSRVFLRRWLEGKEDLSSLGDAPPDAKMVVLLLVQGIHQGALKIEINLHPRSNLSSLRTVTAEGATLLQEVSPHFLEDVAKQILFLGAPLQDSLDGMKVGCLCYSAPLVYQGARYALHIEHFFVGWDESMREHDACLEALDAESDASVHQGQRRTSEKIQITIAPTESVAPHLVGQS